MEVVFSKSVETSLEEYKESLKHYPISRQRALEKYKKMHDSLVELGNIASIPPTCMQIDLGQSLDKNGNPRNPNLKRYNYKDESGFQWAFACLYDQDANTITITKMIPSIRVVKEEKDNGVAFIRDLMQRVDSIK